MHVNQYCLLHNWEKNHKWDLKVDCATSGISFAFFLSFLSREFTLNKASPALCSLFFLLPNQRGIHKSLFKKIKEGILNNTAAGTSLRGSAITHDTHAAKLTQL